jgi:hypothetical protein
VLPAPIKSEVRTFPERLQHVPGRLCHGGHSRRYAATGTFLPFSQGAEEDVNTIEARVTVAPAR